MAEFKNNKEGKIDELRVRPFHIHEFPAIKRLRQASITKQKAAEQKQRVVVLTHQKDLKTAELELGEHTHLSPGAQVDIQRPSSRAAQCG
jgi:hypothetical protein